TERLFTPEFNGDYRVAYFRPGEGCEVRISDAYTAIVTSVEDELIPGDINIEEVSIYPNPANNHIYISNAPNGTEIEVYGLDGRTFKPEVQTESTRLDVDISGLSSGLYVISITTPLDKYLYRFIKK
ncbi:MAG: T9SS type A sorting domain-containing protein, partial [Cyclobacteriaceae bacterium]